MADAPRTNASDGSSDTAEIRHGGLWAGIFLFLITVAANCIAVQRGDSANYYLEGLLTLKGYLPYLEIAENKGPLMFYASAIAAYVSGWDVVGALVLYRFFELLFFAAVFSILRIMKFSLNTRAIALAAFALAYAGAIPYPDETIYSEIPEACFRAAALFFYLKSKRLGAAGACIAIASLFRQTALIDLSLIFIDRVYLILRGERSFRQFCSDCLRLLSGAAIPLVLALGISLSQGWLDDFVHQALVWNRQFSLHAEREMPLFSVVSSLIFSPAFGAIVFLTFLGVLVLIACRRFRVFSSEQQSSQSVVLLLLVGHLAESFASPLWYPHHLIPSLGVMAVVTAYAIEFGLQFAGEQSGKIFSRVFLAGACLSALFLLMSRAAQLETYDIQARQDAALSSWISDHTTIEDRILVWGYAANLYLDACRLPASRFHHNLSLTNQSGRFAPIDSRFLAQFREDLLRQPPKYVILYSGKDSAEDFARFAPVGLPQYRLIEMTFQSRDYFLLESTL